MKETIIKTDKMQAELHLLKEQKSMDKHESTYISKRNHNSICNENLKIWQCIEITPNIIL